MNESAEEFAGKLFDAVHESCGLVSCDTGADVGWAPEEAIPAMAVLIESRDHKLTEELRTPMACGHPKACWRTAEEIAASTTMCTAEATRPDRNPLILPYCTACAEIAAAVRAAKFEASMYVYDAAKGPYVDWNKIMDYLAKLRALPLSAPPEAGGEK